jgi:hypothetical protein
MAKGPHPASPAKGRGEKDGSDFIDPDAVLTVAGNNRRVQRRRAPRRRLFGKKAKEAFLESFATTANVAASAEAIGFSEGAVYTHRRKDPEFRELFWMALEQATGKLAALRIRDAIVWVMSELALGRLAAAQPRARAL